LEKAMSPDEIAQVVALAEETKEIASKATEGPWDTDLCYVGIGASSGCALTETSEDAAFIARARTAAPALADAVVRLAEKVRQLGLECDVRLGCQQALGQRCNALEVENGKLAAEVERLRGDRCDVCDEDGLIYVVTGYESDGHEIEHAELCPQCEGTRSGVTSRVVKERDRLKAKLETLIAEVASCGRYVLRFQSRDQTFADLASDLQDIADRSKP